MSERSPVATPRARIDFACFELAGETWAVPIASVREILATPRLTPLPDAPAVIEGVIDLRGTLIPIVDLAALLAGAGAGGGAASPALERGRTVVVEARGLVVGFRVERATQVVSTGPDSMERIPGLTREVGCRVVGAVIRRAAAPPILVLELDVLIERVLRGRAVEPANGEVAA
jgi:purine-binding chemotaxis protein CheW